MRFLDLCHTFERLERTSGALEMREILAKFLKETTPQEAKITAYLLQGKLGPSFKAPEFGLARKMIQRAIWARKTVSSQELESWFAELGDWGKVAEKVREKEGGEGKGLEIEEVFQRLERIALVSGPGSQEEKLRLLNELLSDLYPLEARYVIRTVLGTLRLGVGDMTFLYALSLAKTGVPDYKEKLEKAFNLLSDLGEVARVFFEEGIEAIEKIKPKAGWPIVMMAAQRIQDLEELPEHIPGEVLAEYKYDGERVQAHRTKEGEVVLFSRRHENITHQYPEIVKTLKENFPEKELIIEGEAVAVDPKTQKLLPFQTLMRRRRKYEVHLFAKEIPVKFFVFDILLWEGESLLEKPLKERLELLKEKVPEVGVIQNPIRLTTEDLGELEEFFRKAVEEGAEGLMLKNLEGIYRAGARGWLWIKYKKDYTEELSDTFDLVVVGALWGRGKRAGTYGSLLLASFDPETNKFYSFTKVGAGFTDEDLANLRKILDPYRIDQKHHLVETEMEMEVWFEPVKVMEVRGAEITISPVHTVAKDKIKEGGLALRFPRFVRWREDKDPQQTTTPQEIYQIYLQSKK